MQRQVLPLTRREFFHQVWWHLLAVRAYHVDVQVFLPFLTSYGFGDVFEDFARRKDAAVWRDGGHRLERLSEVLSRSTLDGFWRDA